MIGNDLMLGGVYIVLTMMLVLSGLMVRREPVARLLTYGLAWVAIFGAGFILFTFRDNLSWVWQRVRAEATGEPVRQGAELRIPMAIDGHFWVPAKLNGHTVRFMVDSGASVTTISSAVAKDAGIVIGSRRGVVNTANGAVLVAQGTADRLEVGPIVRTGFPVDVNDRDDTNLLGMNFLSSLQGWRVEGSDLVLVP